MAFTKIQIISNAMTRIGQDAVNQLSALGEVGSKVENLYDLLYPALLAEDNWRFNVRLQQLSKLVETPIIDTWRNVFQLPADYLTLIRLYPRGDFQIYEDKVFSNSNELKAEYRFLTTEANLPAYFVNYFTYALAEDISLAIALQESYDTKMKAKKELAYAKALAADGYSHPNAAIVDAPFIDVRFGNRGLRGG